MQANKRTKGEIERIAVEMRKHLSVPQQAELFRYALEAGYLAALADGTVDATELKALVDAMAALSDGLVVEWEIDAMIEECNECIGTQGHHERCRVIGEKLKGLGNAYAGLLLAAYVALATNGLSQREGEMLERIATAAGLPAASTANICKRAKTALG